jgi:hypothetical protein
LAWTWFFSTSSAEIPFFLMSNSYQIQWNLMGSMRV